MAPPLAYLAYYLLGPTVDNILDVRTASDLRVLKKYPVSGASLQELIATKYRTREWNSYHEDEIFATRIDCWVLDDSGKTLLLSWEVRHDTPPRDWVAKRDLYITPLTRSAAQLAPTLLPPGVQPGDLALSRYHAGVVYDIAHEKKRNGNRS